MTKKLELAVGVTIAFIVALALTVPTGAVDWVTNLQPATIAFAQGQSPYSVEGVFNPPWTFILLLPLAYLPLQVVTLVGVLAYLFAGLRAGLHHRLAAILLLSPPVQWCLALGNIDWIVLVGFFVQPLWLALFLMTVKPQLGLPFIVLRLWRERKPLHILPVAIAMLLSLVVYGPWPLQDNPMGRNWNTSLWPWSAVVAAPLFIIALWRKSQWATLLLTPFMAPYITIHGYAITLYGIAAKSRRLLYAAFVLAWTLTFWRFLLWQA